MFLVFNLMLLSVITKAVLRYTPSKNRQLKPSGLFVNFPCNFIILRLGTPGSCPFFRALGDKLSVVKILYDAGSHICHFRFFFLNSSVGRLYGLLSEPILKLVTMCSSCLIGWMKSMSECCSTERHTAADQQTVCIWNFFANRVT